MDGLRYSTEGDLEVRKPKGSRLAIEFLILGFVLLLAFRFGGFHKGGPLADLEYLDWISSACLAAAVTGAWALFRMWRIQALSRNED